MSEWSWLGVVLVALFFVYGWYHDHRVMPRRQAKQMAEAEKRRTSEEYVNQRQMEFEKRLREGAEIGLPDAVRGREAHIWRYLMLEWFNKLAAQSRYDESKLRKIRKDWLVYMELLEARKTSNFLALESDDDTERQKYDRQAEEQKLQLRAIEDAFAEAVGANALDKLREMRAKEWDSFNDAGELAPDGYRYRGFTRGRAEEPVPRETTPWADNGKGVMN